MVHTENERVETLHDRRMAFLSEFEKSLTTKTILKSGSILTRLDVSCYVNDRVYRYSANVCLVKHGYYAGTLRVHDDEEGFIDENIFLSDSQAIYGAGRSGNVLIVEHATSLKGMTRIEFESTSA